MHLTVDQATSVFGGSNPSRRTRYKRLPLRELFVSRARIRKAQADGPSRGRAHFQQKMTRDRIPPGAQRFSYATLFDMGDTKHASKVFVVVTMVLLLAPTLAMAAGLTTVVPCGNSGQAACTVCDLAKLAQNILNDGIYIAVFMSALLFAWAGFLYLTNVANSGQHSKAVEVFKNVVIGLVIILASWLVVDVVMRTLVGASVLPWNSIC